MKTIKLLLLFVIVTTISSCTKNADLSSPNPIENTKWKLKYDGVMFHNQNLVKINKGDFIKALFDNGSGTEIKNTNTTFISDNQTKHIRFLEFGTTDATGVGPYSFHSVDNCFEENQEYSFKELLLYNHYSPGTKLPYSPGTNHPYKLAFNINKPNLLYVYYTWRTLFNQTAVSEDESFEWRFEVYELSEETVPPPCTVPISEKLKGTWDVDIISNDMVDSKAKLIIESVTLNTFNLGYHITSFDLVGKFQDGITAQDPVYNFQEGSSFWPNYSNGIRFTATDGTDTFTFEGTYTDEDKIIGRKGDSSFKINDDEIGNFIATKN